MTKTKGRSSRQPVRLSPKPRNTVSLILDGTVEEVLENYRQCQSHFRYWLFTNAAFRVRIGDNILYTTPLDGTFYYAVRYKGRHLVFVIDARKLWLVGFFGENGYYEMKSRNKCFYMDSPNTMCTPFDGNHGTLSRGGVGKTKLGVYSFRKAFDAIHNYHGPNYPEPTMLREAIDRMIVYIMETKFSEIYRRNCKAMVTNEFSKLGDDMVVSVVNWSSRSEIVMNGIVLGHDSEAAISQTKQWLQEMYVLHVDATYEGFFDHAPLSPEPRTEVWCTIDIGEGDDDIHSVETPVLLPPPAPRHYRATGKRGMKRGFSDINQVKEKRVIRGPRGGGVGGSPNVPEWFSNWRQELQDKTECDLVFSKSKELDLCFIEAKELHLKQKNEDKKYPNKKKIEKINGENSLSEKGLGQQCTTAPCINDEELGQYTLAQSIHCKDLGQRTGSPIRKTEDLSSQLQESLMMQKTPGLSTIQSDVQDLRGQSYLSDSVINRYFNYLSSVFPSEDVLLVSPSESMMYSWNADAIPVNDISSRRLVLFPVNNNTQLDQADGGTHWSLLVIDATNTTIPRFIHHDSSEGLNFHAARHLANSLRHVLPAMQETVVEANTPRQGTGNDCAVYVMAITKVILSWWQTWSQSDTDWSETMFREVNASSVSNMRLELATAIEQEEANKSFGEPTKP